MTIWKIYPPLTASAITNLEEIGHHLEATMLLLEVLVARRLAKQGAQQAEHWED